MFNTFSVFYQRLKSRFADSLDRFTSSTPNQDSAHSPDQLLLDPPPIWSRILIWSLGIGSLSLIVWASFNTVEETAQLPGQLETFRSQVKVKSPESALISEVKVRQHDEVDAGQLLLTLNRDDLTPQISLLQQKLLLIDARNSFEVKSFETQRKQLEAQVSLNRDILVRLKSLYEQGSSSEVQYLEKQNQVFQNEQDLLALIDDHAKSLNVRQIERNDILNQIRELTYRSSQFDITSPINGSLQSLNVNFAGERVQPGELLATIVPHEGLIASVQVSSRLSAPVNPGTSAEITVDAFPANDFGTLSGFVKSISPTTSVADEQGTSPAYVARIEIDRNEIPSDFPPDALRSGMGVTARVVLEEKRTISIIFNFVQDLFKPLVERR